MQVIYDGEKYEGEKDASGAHHGRGVLSGSIGL
jgi:hypothetical protein